MQPIPQFSRTGFVFKVVTTACAIALTAGMVYATDTMPDRTSDFDAAHAVATAAKPPAAAVVQVSEVWAADESAAGSRPDASH